MVENKRPSVAESLRKKKDKENLMVFITSLCFAILVWMHTPVMSFPVEIDEAVERQIYLGPMEITAMSMGRTFPIVEPYAKYLLLPGVFMKETVKVIGACYFDAQVNDDDACDASKLFDYPYLLKEADYSWLVEAYTDAAGSQRSIIESGSFLVVKGAIFFFYRPALYSAFMAQLLLGFGVMKAGFTPLPSMFYLGFILACAIIKPSIPEPEEDPVKEKKGDSIAKATTTGVAKATTSSAVGGSKKSIKKN